MRNYISFLFFIVSLNLFSQTTFDKGYYITNSGDTIHCLIKNLDWYNNPTFIEYKMTETSDIIKDDIDNIKYFEINDKAKYIRANVKIDFSSIQINSLNRDRSVVLEEKQLFLKVLVSGPATLYQYKKGDITKFFIQKESSEIELLIFKKYMYNSNLAYNNTYQQQLLTNLNCDKITTNKIKNTKYERKDLVTLFEIYNYCVNPNETQDKYVEKKGEFNVSIRPRVNFSNLNFDISLSRNESMKMLNFGSVTNFGVGVELEYVFPFDRNRWSLLSDPNYMGFSKKVDLYKVNYKVLEVPVGVRYAIHLNNNSKVFANAYYMLNFNLGSAYYNNNQKIVNLNSFKEDFGFGLGYNFKQKYSLEFRVMTKRNIFRQTYYTGEISNFSLILGYRIF